METMVTAKSVLNACMTENPANIRSRCMSLLARLMISAGGHWLRNSRCCLSSVANTSCFTSASTSLPGIKKKSLEAVRMIATESSLVTGARTVMLTGKSVGKQQHKTHNATFPVRRFHLVTGAALVGARCMQEDSVSATATTISTFGTATKQSTSSAFNRIYFT